MPTVVYSLDNAIENFFSDVGASSSRMQCDDFVRRRYGENIRPADIQGSSSYTVITGPSDNKIIQFREQDALLDMNMLALAKAVHGDVVPICSELGWVGDPNGSQLGIYEMDRLPGEIYIITRTTFARDQQVNVVHSLARFVETLYPLTSHHPAKIKFKFLCAIVAKWHANGFGISRYVCHQDRMLR